MTWHGYPQDPAAHPERPWWHRNDMPTFAAYMAAGGSGEPPVVGWTRTDGREAEEDDLALEDRIHPLPHPPVLPGQVWLMPALGPCLIVALASKGGESYPVMLRIIGGAPALGAYPPRPGEAGGSLVWGPHSPWEPPQPGRLNVPGGLRVVGGGDG